MTEAQGGGGRMVSGSGSGGSRPRQRVLVEESGSELCLSVSEIGSCAWTKLMCVASDGMDGMKEWHCETQP